jgi:hypothetical protein
MLGLEYQHTGLAVTQSLIKSKPELVRNITKAFVEAIHYFKTHRKESLAVLQKYLKTDGRALEETYEAIAMTLIPRKPYPTLKGIQIMLREMGAKDPRAAAANQSSLWISRSLKSWTNPDSLIGCTRRLLRSRAERRKARCQTDGRRKSDTGVKTDVDFSGQCNDCFSQACSTLIPYPGENG